MGERTELRIAEGRGESHSGTQRKPKDTLPNAWGCTTKYTTEPTSYVCHDVRDEPTLGKLKAIALGTQAMGE